MLLTLKNIGKVSDASIELNGITVIAGENDTGKSTVGKMLFCLFNSFYKIDEKIRIEREQLIDNVIENSYFDATGALRLGFDEHSISDKIVEHSKDYVANIELLKKYISEYYMSVDQNFTSYLNDDLLTNISKKIIDFLDVSDDEIKANILRKRFNSEFNMQISHINNPTEISQVTLKIKDNIIDIAVSQNNIVIKNNINIFTELVYVDDPFVLDDLKKHFPYYLEQNDNHRSNLKSKLLNTKPDTTVKGTIEEIVTNKKLENIFSKLSTVCNGELIKTDNAKIAFKTKGFKEALDISNLSTGLKTFVILQTLLKNGVLVENGTIVLDEPEIHLHPEWQLLFAEIIVLIQKEFGMHILLNTHSPYFLNAIEVYAAKYEIADKCKYYLAENQEDKSVIKDVSDDIEIIYAKLARPLQDLENEGYCCD